ncbi:MAG: hypothetical protein ACSI46_09685 [Gloeotrichia echinulata DVL01]|nr:hypothetical protein [Gloeotrichia echinulata DEX184]
MSFSRILVMILTAQGDRANYLQHIPVNFIFADLLKICESVMTTDLGE